MSDDLKKVLNECCALGRIAEDHIEALEAQLAEARKALADVQENWSQPWLVRKIARRALPKDPSTGSGS